MAIHQYTSVGGGSRRDDRNITAVRPSHQPANQPVIQHPQLEVKSVEEQKRVRKTVRVTERHG